ncbi:MAG: alpha/beta hydrolase [Pseudomonadota bacterium]
MSAQGAGFDACVVRLGDGQHCHTLQSGSAQPLIFVHGLPGSGRDFLPLASRLAARYRCILIDRAGYGASPLADPARPMSVQRSANDLAELVRLLNLTEVVLIGWSYGGHVVTDAALLMPERVHSLVFLGSVGPAFEWPTTFIDRLLYQSPFGPRLLKVVKRCTPGILRSELNAAVGKTVSDDEFKNFLTGLSRPGVIDRWLLEGRNWQPSTMRPEAIDHPCLVVHGRRDSRVPIDVARDLADRINCRSFAELPDASHWPFSTHAERVEAEIDSFLWRLSGREVGQ